MSKKKSKATRRAESSAAQRAAEVRKQHEAQERRRRNLLVGAAAVVVLAIVVAVGYGITAAQDTTGAAGEVPNGAVDSYALPVGDSSAPVTVSVYEDFMCPYCGQFEAASRKTFEKYADQGRARIHYYPLNYLDRSSAGTRYSTRASSALAVVLDTAGPDVAKRFHDLLFENQPQEGTPGLSDDKLVDLAVQAGAERSRVESEIKSDAFEQWVANASDSASKKGYTTTPTVLVDGEQVDGKTIPEVVANAEAAIKKGSS